MPPAPTDFAPARHHTSLYPPEVASEAARTISAAVISVIRRDIATRGTVTVEGLGSFQATIENGRCVSVLFQMSNALKSEVEAAFTKTPKPVTG